MHERVCLGRSSVIPETPAENLVQKRQPSNYLKEHTWVDDMNLNLWHCPQMDTANRPTGVKVKAPKTGSLEFSYCPAWRSLLLFRIWNGNRSLDVSALFGQLLWTHHQGCVTLRFIWWVWMDTVPQVSLKLTLAILCLVLSDGTIGVQ